MRKSDQGQQGAEGRRRQARENRQRVDVALVEDAEHDVDDEHGDDQQHGEVRERALERGRRALELARDAVGHGVLRHLPHPAQHVAERGAPREPERHRDGRQLPVVVHRLRADLLRQRRQRVERNQRTGRPRCP